MVFSLKQYLNESIQSNILFNEILNEPGGFFKCLLCDNSVYNITSNDDISEYAHDKYSRIRYVQCKLNSIVSHFMTYSEFERSDILKVTNPDVIDAYKMKQLHEQYIKYFNLFIKYFKSIFDKPEPKIFSEIITGHDISEQIIDLQNITDSNFKKYTYQDIKNDNENFVNNMMSKNILWFDGNHKFLGLTRYSVIKIVASNFITERMSYQAESITHDVMYRIKTKKFMNFDGKELDFPFTPYMGLHDSFLQSFVFKIPREKTYKKAGNPISKSSNVYKIFGFDKTCYCYVYTPNKIDYDMLQGLNSTVGPDNISYGFNEVILNSEKRKNKQRDFKNYAKQYKWKYDIFGKIIPYYDRKISYLTIVDENGKLKTTPNKSNNYYDIVCDTIRDANRSRYQKTMAVMKTKKLLVEEFEPKIQEIEKIIINSNGFVVKFNNMLREKFNNGGTAEKFRIKQYIDIFSDYVAKRANELSVKGLGCIELYNKLLDMVVGNNYSTYDINSKTSYLRDSLEKFDNTYETYKIKKKEMYQYLNGNDK